LVEDLKAFLMETDEETMKKKKQEKKDKRAVRKKKEKKKEHTKDSEGRLRKPLKAEGKTKSKARNPKGEFYFVGFYIGCFQFVCCHISPLDGGVQKTNMHPLVSKLTGTTIIWQFFTGAG
jgi:hypothetical protein